MPSRFTTAITASAMPAAITPALETCRRRAHIACMKDSEEKPVMEPFPDKVENGWHVIIRYHQGHERRIDGFASKDEAVD